ncbi:hypothetical protein STCU_01615 [Strigomonas culicis]|uniref:Uncharacterized protein n=1 Tax=Strigomonas culicis TaxID=28005 RepID=S9UTW0_9TRYP|nr:hypothetical protein STCU_01615 [Strigomonas culicis]|eukprot:EPY34377.1 hypothetical protein STCU_01615 [Strigomonas culicis]
MYPSLLQRLALYSFATVLYFPELRATSTFDVSNLYKQMTRRTATVKQSSKTSQPSISSSHEQPMLLKKREKTIPPPFSSFLSFTSCSLDFSPFLFFFHALATTLHGLARLPAAAAGWNDRVHRCARRRHEDDAAVRCVGGGFAAERGRPRDGADACLRARRLDLVCAARDEPHAADLQQGLRAHLVLRAGAPALQEHRVGRLRRGVAARVVGAGAGRPARRPALPPQVRARPARGVLALLRVLLRRAAQHVARRRRVRLCAGGAVPVGRSVLLDPHVVTAELDGRHAAPHTPQRARPRRPGARAGGGALVLVPPGLPRYAVHAARRAAAAPRPQRQRHPRRATGGRVPCLHRLPLRLPPHPLPPPADRRRADGERRRDGVRPADPHDVRADHARGEGGARRALAQGAARLRTPRGAQGADAGGARSQGRARGVPHGGHPGGAPRGAPARARDAGRPRRGGRAAGRRPRPAGRGLHVGGERPLRTHA